MDIAVTFTGTIEEISKLMNTVSGLSLETTAAPVTAPAVAETTPPAVADDSKTDAPEKDSEGNIWDARIHSGGKNILKSGAWRRKKGVGDDEYERVIAENRAAQTPPPPQGDSLPPAPLHPPAAGATPPPPQGDGVPVLPEMTFQEFMLMLAGNPNIQAVIPKLVEEISIEHNTQLTSIADIQSSPEMIKTAVKVLSREGLLDQ